MNIECTKCGHRNEDIAFHLGCPTCGTKHAQGAQMPAFKQEPSYEATEVESDESESESEAETGTSDQDS